MTIVPKNLTEGSSVRIISTARKVELDKIEPAIALLKSWGYVVELGTHLLGAHHQFSGTLEQRADDLQAAINSEVQMIWFARGGYGSVSLVDQIDFSPLLKKPKWLVGYSDVTGILCHLRTLGLASLHAPMPINIPDRFDGSDLVLLHRWLEGGNLNYELPQHPLNRIGSAKGEIVGGNLSLIYSILGSKSMPNTDRKILFIEDLDEYLYHIDRMMLNLKRNGVLGNLSALVVGGMTDMNDNPIPFGCTAEEIIRSYVDEYDYPVYFGFSAGHTPVNFPLPIGVSTAIHEGILSIAH